MKMITKQNAMPGPSAPAFRFSAAAMFALIVGAATITAQPALAQQSPAPQQVQAPPLAEPSVQPPASTRPVPGQLELSKMLWSTIAAVDHANRSGNYSVLRDISAQGFQAQNNAARLAEIFTGLRNSNVDLSNAFLVPPTYYEAPQLLRDDLFRVRGVFQLRPVSIGFEVYYLWEQGRWKLFGIDVQPLAMMNQPRAEQ